ncbi:aldo/keto reductase [soil metagenome]
MTASLQNETTTLRDGVRIPRLGFGTFQMDGDEVERAVGWALELGYRLIDTASVYGNEREVGSAIRGSGVSREDVFLTSKVWNSDQGYDSALRAFDASLERLGTEYLDLYLIHWPVEGRFVETWRALERLLGEERVRAIGVSNFLIPHLRELLDAAETVPAVNQIELHPRLRQPELLDFCREHDIQPEAWSPLMKGDVTELEDAVEIGERHGKTAAQTVLRWELQRDVIPIPKSSHRGRIAENADVFDFALTEWEMATLDGLDRGERVGPDPADFDF